MFKTLLKLIAGTLKLVVLAKDDADKLRSGGYHIHRNNPKKNSIKDESGNLLHIKIH